MPDEIDRRKRVGSQNRGPFNALIPARERFFAAFFQADAHSCVASLAAEIMDPGWASPVQAISNAVPVVNGRADNGQAQSDIHRAMERQSLQRDVALIMIHADEGVAGLPRAGQECRIGWDRAGNINTPNFCGFDFREDDGFFFPVSEQTVFACMRIQPERDHFGGAVLDLGQSVVGEIDHLAKTVTSEETGDVGIAAMAGDKAGSDLLRILQHAATLRFCKGGQHFRFGRGKRMPAACSASLLSGAVTMASTSPAREASMALLRKS